MLSKLEGGCFDRYMSFAAWRSDGGWTTMLWTSLGHLFFCCYSVTRSQHGNINSMLLSLKRRRSGCQQEWLLQLSTLLLLKKIYSRTHHKYWHVSLCAEQVWQKKKKKRKKNCWRQADTVLSGTTTRTDSRATAPGHSHTACIFSPAQEKSLQRSTKSDGLVYKSRCSNSGIMYI